MVPFDGTAAINHNPPLHRIFPSDLVIDILADSIRQA
jgi:hypothetical protein